MADLILLLPVISIGLVCWQAGYHRGWCRGAEETGAHYEALFAETRER